MTKVGFWYDYGTVYSGGLNYFRNLLYALSRKQSKEFDFFVFLPTNVDPRISIEFGNYAKVVLVDLLSKGTVPWFLHRLIYRAFGWEILAERVLRKHKIEIVSHPSMLGRGSRHFKTIQWIADFQFLHLPHLFPGLSIERTSKILNTRIRKADAVVMSSNDSLKDFLSIASTSEHAKAKVLRFVSQPPVSFDPSFRYTDRSLLEERYSFSGKYFHLPNQFWEHKNHTIVLEALRLLKDRGIEVVILCTGWFMDPRDPSFGYGKKVLSYVEKHALQKSFRILGVIPYFDMLSLMFHSSGVINPSRFEGWSSSVEEAKSLDKIVILSDIDVHREQAAPKGKYFNPDSSEELASILELTLHTDSQGSGEPSIDCDVLSKRTESFADCYLEILRSVLAAQVQTKHEGRQQ